MSDQQSFPDLMVFLLPNLSPQYNPGDGPPPVPLPVPPIPIATTSAAKEPAPARKAAAGAGGLFVIGQASPRGKTGMSPRGASPVREVG